MAGWDNFVRTNPKSDHFPVSRFHHVEFWCGDATTTAGRFSWGLGMPLIAKSDLSTGNTVHASYLLRSGELNFLFTAPYSPSISTKSPSSASIPTFSLPTHRLFTSSHGLAIRAIAIEVDSAFSTFSDSISRGAKPVAPPILLSDGRTAISEVQLYGDVVLRFVSFSANEEGKQDYNNFLPGFEHVVSPHQQTLDYGIRRLDHVVGNLPEIRPVFECLKKFTGFHDFVEFTTEEIGTVDSGMNTKMLANNDENVLLALNEPIYGTKQRSQVETFLEHNEGSGVQHLALITDDIFYTLREMRKRTGLGGFGFMPPPLPTYYMNLKGRVGDELSDEQIADCEKLGVLVDKDDEGTLLQIFTKPVGDRPTIFIEIIQRIGCILKDGKGKLYQKGGCGGFGKGNVSELFKSVQEYEKMVIAKQI